TRGKGLAAPPVAAAHLPGPVSQRRLPGRVRGDLRGDEGRCSFQGPDVSFRPAGGRDGGRVADGRAALRLGLYFWIFPRAWAAALRNRASCCRDSSLRAGTAASASGPISARA